MEDFDSWSLPVIGWCVCVFVCVRKLALYCTLLRTSREWNFSTPCFTSFSAFFLATGGDVVIRSAMSNSDEPFESSSTYNFVIILRVQRSVFLRRGKKYSQYSTVRGRHVLISVKYSTVKHFTATPETDHLYSSRRIWT